MLKTERFEMRLDPDLLQRLDDWRAGQVGVPSRAEAVRQLIDASLSKGMHRYLISYAWYMYQHPASETSMRLTPEWDYGHLVYETREIFNLIKEIEDEIQHKHSGHAIRIAILGLTKL